MANWIEYTGSGEQLKELLTTKSKFMVDNKWAVFHKPTTLNMPATEDNLNWLASLLRDTKVKRYLICQLHPYADLIKIWADTGCEVWVREPIKIEFEYNMPEGWGFVRYGFPKGGEHLDYAMTGYMYKDYVTDQPNWNIPNAIFRLTPFED